MIDNVCDAVKILNSTLAISAVGHHHALNLERSSQCQFQSQTTFFTPLSPRTVARPHQPADRIYPARHHARRTPRSVFVRRTFHRNIWHCLTIFFLRLTRLPARYLAPCAWLNSLKRNTKGIHKSRWHGREARKPQDGPHGGQHRDCFRLVFSVVGPGGSSIPTYSTPCEE